MSLRVWLPLVRDNLNQGLDDLQPTNLGTVSFIDGGKLGKCLSAGTSTQTANGISYPTNLVSELGTQFSCAIWVKPLGTHVHYNGTFVSSGNWNAKCWSFGVNQNNTKVDIFSKGYNRYLDCEVPVNTWTHLCCTSDNGTVKLYKNGVYVGQATGLSESLDSDATNFCVGRETYANGYFSFNGNINDLRIYDHALSPKEVKLLSQGLVCHYKLSDVTIQQMNNCYVYPTFNTSAITGGWYHWGLSGHIGTYGQNTDKQYIYNKENMYSHWVADDEEATQDYLVYQSPAFEGGYRSLVCILKEENGTKIDETIIYPAWNSDDPSSGVAQHKWTSIQYLHDGFYLCKVDGFKQTGSNDLVGMYITKGHKVYLSECYLENDRQVSSDIFYNTNIIYDSSGYNNHGNIVTSGLVASVNSPRNNICTYFNGTAQISRESISAETRTISFWLKTTKTNHVCCFADYKSRLGFGFKSDGTIVTTCSSFNIKTYSPSAITDNVWHHIGIVKKTDDSDVLLYVDGILQSTRSGADSWTHTTDVFTLTGRSYGSPAKMTCYLSDFRLYATALSAADIQELYNAPVSVANTGAMLTQGEFVEVAT